MHRAREIVHCMGICLLLTGCQPEPDSQGGGGWNHAYSRI